MTPTKEQLEALAEKHTNGFTVLPDWTPAYILTLDQLDAYFLERLKMEAVHVGYYGDLAAALKGCWQPADAPLYALEILK